MSRTKLSGAERRRRMKADRQHEHNHTIYPQKDPVAEPAALEDVVSAEAPETNPMPAELAPSTVSTSVVDDVDAVVPAIHPAPEPKQQQQQQQQPQQEQLQLAPLAPRPQNGPGHGHENVKGSQHARHRSLPQSVPRHRQHPRNHHHERRVSYPPAAPQQQQKIYYPPGYAIDPQVHYQQLTHFTPRDDFSYHHANTMPLHPYHQQHQQQQVQLQQQYGGYASPNSSNKGSLVRGYGFQGGAEGNINIINGHGTYYPPSSSYPYHHHEQSENAPIPYYDGPPPPSSLATGYGTLAAGYPSSPYPGHTPSSSYGSQSSYSPPFYGNPQPPNAHVEELSFPHYYQQQQLQGGMGRGLEGGMDCSNYSPPHPEMMTTAIVQQGNSSSSSRSSSIGSGSEEEMKMLEQGERGMVETKREEEEGREELLANGVRKVTQNGLTHYTYPDDAARLTQAEAMLEMSASDNSHHSYLSFEQQQQQQQQYQCYTPPGSPPMQPYQHVSPLYSPVSTSPVVQYGQQFFGNAPHPQYPYHEKQQALSHDNGPPYPPPPSAPLPLPSS